MAFIPQTYLDDKVRPWTYLPLSAAAHTVGEYISGQNAVCMRNKTTVEGELTPCVKVDDNIIFEAPLTVNSSSIAIGTAYTVTSAGVTATTASGVFVITEFDGKTAGDLVRGYFK